MTPRPASGADPLAVRYAAVRARTSTLIEPLSEADCQVQSMPDASPVKWHLAHVSWFFETFVLERFEAGFRPHHPAFRVLFNSYYHGIGAQHARTRRGLVTRPGLDEVLAYRRAVDERMLALLERPMPCGLAPLVELGLQHEQQHQELLLTDVKHLLSCNPLDPVYRPQWPLQAVADPPRRWLPFDGGPVPIGHQGDGFAFDNEGPRHTVWLQPYALANRLVTHGDWSAFVDDGGYTDPRWWLSAGWDWVRAQGVEAPMYWRREGRADWSTFTLHGRMAIDPHTPITHVGLYEADAYARWRSAQDDLPLRLPTEAEWEHAARVHRLDPTMGHFADRGACHPVPLAQAGDGPLQLFGDVWEWTSSSYAAYPGYRPWEGAVGEYNGKFMVNQYVLRGGSCATPRGHVRASYRNFFPAETRWQFSGVRLARDLPEAAT